MRWCEGREESERESGASKKKNNNERKDNKEIKERDD